MIEITEIFIWYTHTHIATLRVLVRLFCTALHCLHMRLLTTTSIFASLISWVRVWVSALLTRAQTNVIIEFYYYVFFFFFKYRTKTIAAVASIPTSNGRIWPTFTASFVRRTFLQTFMAKRKTCKSIDFLFK